MMGPRSHYRFGVRLTHLPTGLSAEGWATRVPSAADRIARRLLAARVADHLRRGGLDPMAVEVVRDYDLTPERDEVEDRITGWTVRASVLLAGHGPDADRAFDELVAVRIRHAAD
jgi:hypothetical protein